MKTEPYTDQWRECNSCGDMHRDSARVWIKNYGLDMSSCPACGAVGIAPKAKLNLSKLQLDLFKEAA